MSEFAELWINNYFNRYASGKNYRSILRRKMYTTHEGVVCSIVELYGVTGGIISWYMHEQEQEKVDLKYISVASGHMIWTKYN